MSVQAQSSHLVDNASLEVLDVLGLTIQFLTPPEPDDRLPCVMLGTIPSGMVVPLHSHADAETFLMRFGEIEGLVESPRGFTWVRMRSNDIFHVPNGAKHAFRNRSRERAEMVIVSTSKMARFFQEIGTPLATIDAPSGPPSEDTIRHFLETAEQYGYWNASPEENTQVGLSLPAT
jgi:quercetin dioxygenase-like cupin family protein